MKYTYHARIQGGGAKGPCPPPSPQNIAPPNSQARIQGGQEGLGPPPLQNPGSAYAYHINIKVTMYAVKISHFSIWPPAFLQHVHDYLQCQNRYTMSVLPRMKLKNKIADMWIDLGSLAGDLNLCSADLGGSTTYDL